LEKPLALIIEDDRDIVALFRHVLDLAGYHTEIFLNGQAAIDHLAASTPNIVLLDLNLPGVSGVEILNRMNADDRLRDVPVVVITALPQLLKTLMVKPKLILTKPVEIEQMTHLIQQICPTEKSMETLPYDVVTGLYNRTFFVGRLKLALEHTKQHNHTPFAVLYLDLQRSLKLDYLFGREHNRKVMKETAMLLKSLLRPTDTLARIGDNLFGVLIEEVKNRELPIVIASRIQNKIRKHLARLESELQVRANVGIVLCGREYSSVDHILRDAENALDLAKLDRNKMLQQLRSKSISTASDMSLIVPRPR